MRIKQLLFTNITKKNSTDWCCNSVCFIAFFLYKFCPYAERPT